MTEYQLQAKCFQWAWNEYPETRKLLFHIPNGGFRNKIEASNLKSIGVVSGVADLCFIWNGEVSFFEIKSEKGKLSQNQEEWQMVAAFQGIFTYIIKDFDTFKSIFQKIVNGDKSS